MSTTAIVNTTANDVCESESRSAGSVHVLVEAPPPTEVVSRFQEFRVSNAFDKALSKERCGLCKLYFRRDTVNYKVPNHRIHELQKKWQGNDKLEGRRYSCPSFLYTTVIVCSFCSQFFSIMHDQLPEHTNDALQSTVLKTTTSGPKLVLATKVERSDVAQGKRTYQSSTVDNKFSSFAVLPPFDLMARTRREADPWWEIDLGQTMQLIDLSFEIIVGVRQHLHIFISLLPKTLGFEDPFLDNAKRQALHVKQLILPVTDKARTEKIHWDLPAHAHCLAIRVQLLGVQTLGIRKFQARRGDDYTPANESDLMLQTTDSFAALPMSTVKDALKEYAQSDVKLFGNSSVIKTKDELHKSKLRSGEERVWSLSGIAKEKYEELQLWKGRVHLAMKTFSIDELTSMYKVIFKYTADLNINSNTVKQVPLNEHDLFSDIALGQHYPRCDLTELHGRLRQILKWIDSKMQLKQVGALAMSEKWIAFANNADRSLFQFMTIIKHIEYFWNQQEIDEQEKATKALKERQRLEQIRVHNSACGKRLLAIDATQNVILAKVAEQRGCCWTQFLILFDLLFHDRCQDIPAVVFNIDMPDIPIGNRIIPDDKSEYSYKTGDVMSVGSLILPGLSKSCKLQDKSFMAGASCSPISFFREFKEGQKSLRKTLCQQVM
jgi:hypothetical protein